MEVAGGRERLGCRSHEAAVCRLRNQVSNGSGETKSSKKRKTQQIKQLVNMERERLSEHCEAVLGGWAEGKSLKGVGSGRLA